MKQSGYVAVVGRTNAGKSTLLNEIMDRKVSIVSDKPQTTRRRILGVLTRPEGQAVFFDTPGVHRPGHQLNRMMVQYIHDSTQTANAILHVVDISQHFGRGEQFVVDLVKKSGHPAVLALNKIDLVRKGRILEAIERYRQLHEYESLVPVSALTGDGVPILLGEVFRTLPEGESLYDDSVVTDSSERFMVMELVREKILHHTRNELPFTTAVLIDLFDESGRAERGFVRVEAAILVERESQKGIVIGAGAAMLKRIGTEARIEVEALLGAKVFLGLHVRVEEGWRDNPVLLNQLGLEP